MDESKILTIIVPENFKKYWTLKNWTLVYPSFTQLFLNYYLLLIIRVLFSNRPDRFLTREISSTDKIKDKIKAASSKPLSIFFPFTIFPKSSFCL